MDQDDRMDSESDSIRAQGAVLFNANGEAVDVVQPHKLAAEKYHDPIDHPFYYINHPSGIECIEVTRHMTFNLGNAIKYLWRAGVKPNADNTEDLRKAIWYINDEIKRLKGSR